MCDDTTTVQRSCAAVDRGSLLASPAGSLNVLELAQAGSAAKSQLNLKAEV